MIEGLAPIAKLKHLKYLDINGKPSDDPAFPNWLSDNITTSLEDLRLSDLKSLPPAIGKFKHLTSLIQNKIESTEVPESIGSLTALRQLLLFGPNRPVTLPASFSSLTALEKLCLRAQMDDIGPLQHLTRLKLLDFEVPEDETLPYPDFLWNMTSLTALQLLYHSLDELPTEIANLKQLKFLQLDMNEIEEIPSSIGDLCALTELRMWNSPQLQTLPESLSNLSRLKVLSFKSCSSLQTLPASIGNL
jgi:Leucine-rich repeat (LRR) protein